MTVYRLITAGTVEEDIANTQKRKERLKNDVLDDHRRAPGDNGDDDDDDDDAGGGGAPKKAGVRDIAALLAAAFVKSKAP